MEVIEQGDSSLTLGMTAQIGDQREKRRWFAGANHLLFSTPQLKRIVIPNEPP
jgi:hypothetical protein